MPPVPLVLPAVPEGCDVALLAPVPPSCGPIPTRLEVALARRLLVAPAASQELMLLALSEPGHFGHPPAQKEDFP